MKDIFKGKTVEQIKAEATAKQVELATLIEAAGDNPTPEQIVEAREITEHIESAIEAANEVAAFTATKSRDFSTEIESAGAVETPAEPTEPVEAAAEGAEPTEPEGDEPTESVEPTEPEAGAEGAEAGTEDKGKVEASAKPKSLTEFSKNRSRPAVPDSAAAVSITASADVPNFSAGSKLDGIADLSKAVVERMKGFTPPNGDGKSENLQKFGVAALRLPFENEFVIDRGDDAMEVLARAANEHRLDEGSLTAAGWCSPSETLYDLAADESLEGILSVPEVQVNRGGFRYTEGPQFADFYANAGFIQTEAQAIANTVKPCYTVECPAFQEVRLDAVGLCIKVPILTNAAYPELVQRFTSGTMIAHAHMINASVISRMVTFAGAARAFTGLGSSVSDAMEALEIVADQRRQAYRLPLGRTMEVVVPFWLRGVYRSDLARRQGVAAEAISDAQVDAHFAARKLVVSYVYDWQPLDETAEVYPATYQVLVYPAGTFVKGVSDVINLQAVYDAASLAVNTYTGLFMEQGLLVAKMQYDADLLTLPICNAGRTGAANLTCV